MSGKDIKLELKQEECYCGIPEFYNMIARKLGYEPKKCNLIAQKSVSAKR